MNAPELHKSFGLTGREFQDHFDVEKYEALAHQQPKGLLLQQMVETNWEAWCHIVREAPWLIYWKNSDAIKETCVTPADLICLVSGCGSVPLAIFTTAVWGFGFEHWLTLQGRASRTPLNELLKQQGVRPGVGLNRKNLWDDRLYRGCGMLMPPEFGELDRWLQPMWDRICISSK